VYGVMVGLVSGRLELVVVWFLDEGVAVVLRVGSQMKIRAPKVPVNMRNSIIVETIQ